MLSQPVKLAISGLFGVSAPEPPKVSTKIFCSVPPGPGPGPGPGSVPPSLSTLTAPPGTLVQSVIVPAPVTAT